MNKSGVDDLGPVGLSTRCIHAGTLPDVTVGGVNSPIYTSTAYAYPGVSGENVYQRYFNTPNQQAVADKVAALEGGEAGLVFGSGMVAISAIFLTQLKPGDHAVFIADIYGGTYALIQDLLLRLEIQVSWATSVESIRAQLTPKTCLIYIESPSNPLLRCVDIAAVAELAQQHQILSVIDNTFATPINQTPLSLGIDVVLHSATKYLNGHSDLNAGVVVGGADFMQKLRACAINLGGMLDAEACARLERGLKTLALRMRQHNENGLLLARALEAHDAVARVYYPGLESSPDRELAKRQMRGFGGMLAVELVNASQVDSVLKRLRIIRPALSLGGVESLICVPAQTSHCSLTREEREAIGISDGLMRVSVGVEDVADLNADFEQALIRVRDWQMSAQVFQSAGRYEVRFVDQATGCERLHTHDYPVVVAVLGGGIAMQMDADARVLSAGEVLYLLPHQRHAVCGFDPDFCGVYTLALFDASVRGSSLRPRLESAAEFIDLCEFLLGNHTEAIKAKRFAEWLLAVSEPVTVGTADLLGAASYLADRVKSLLDAALGERAPFDEIARKCGCSKEHCNRHFKAQYGVSIQTYQLNRKAERARDLLATELTLSEVALEAGFYDQSHLSRIFKSIFQVTPEVYRSQQRTSDQSHTRSSE